jgi:hypothetical protein
MTTKVTMGKPILLCQEKEWQAMTRSRLLKAQHPNQEKLNPITITALCRT